MIGRIAGRIEWRGADHVLIDVRGVGYIVHVSDRTLAALPGVGEACALYTELLVREDLLQLFGFPTMLEKEWHRLLTTVQGVGAKAAMAILGTLGAEGTARAITLGDARAIQAAPGIGPKIAQRVVLELKSKAPAIMAQGSSLMAEAVVTEEEAAPAPAVKAKPARSVPVRPAVTRAAYSADALSALLNLGYGQADAAQAVATVSGEAPEADTAELIRRALKLLMPKN
ncbi:Holliday junction DNA helicase subunit RuvA [Gemmobacter caeni]|uniref:Holliday junction branch migration complex subunit RuvA n=2 Tax=Gemmobacter TaxID=204456 RepID=A0A2T6APQ2_9RHOB|nr:MULTISPECIES: Holliday junction branch migration protein RuvA [Gemmobacter]PTX45801.1 Holliday junction DNA helicase subunit RuvA [Gemmobacter caeni]TWI94106.1 Holliday junction DNA helicase subunit RuvA [Gemmobacter caeni]GHC25912.1 Holliday junction ATP-dependent DNA helicase RuvA [Gemmobacter nanjingensis]